MTAMNKKDTRKPISNFFIKRELQLRLIRKIVAAVLIATLVCVVTLTYMYLVSHRGEVYYKVSLTLGADIGDREQIVSIILPSILISAIVNVFIAVCIGFYASRKYAVPIFKLEQWVQLLKNGRFNVQLNFREKTEMRELCDSCNELSVTLCSTLKAIDNHMQSVKKEAHNAGLDNPELTTSLEKIEALLGTLDFKDNLLEIHTCYMKTDVPPKQ